MENFSRLVYPVLSYKITGILFVVHNELGRFCNEKQCSDYFEKYLKKFNIRYEREKQLPQSFENEFGGRNKVDFIVEDKIIVEMKAKRIVSREDYYQMRRYLRAANKKLGIIANFRDKYLRPKRILNSSAAE